MSLQHLSNNFCQVVTSEHAKARIGARMNAFMARIAFGKLLLSHAGFVLTL